VYDATAVPEVINQDCGIVVDKGDIYELVNAITSICNNKLFSRKGCLSRAKDFNKTDRYREYVKLYEEMINASVIPN
jgi:glycosyltransferase involved in cell wall biosynthesis